MCLCVFALSMSSCALFELDNYDAPAETLKGIVVDVKTGEPVLTDQGGNGTRVRLLETSWKGGSITPLDFYCRPDGSFLNTKLFEADYNVSVDGAFVPLVRTSAEGTVLGNDTKDIHLKGVQELTFEVQPFLKVEFSGVPQMTEGVVSVKVKVTRATTRQELLTALAGTEYIDANANVTDIQLFVSRSSSVGDRAKDTRWSNAIYYKGAEFEDKLGKSVSISSKGTIPSGTRVYIRAAARINYVTPIGGSERRWNYSEIIPVDIP